MENKYPEYIMKKLRERRDLEPNDVSQDEYINKYLPERAFHEVCQWEGLINYSSTIIHWIEDIFKVKLVRD